MVTFWMESRKACIDTSGHQRAASTFAVGPEQALVSRRWVKWEHRSPDQVLLGAIPGRRVACRSMVWRCPM